MLKSIIFGLSLICSAGQQGTSQQTIENGQPTRFELSVERTMYSVAEPVDLTVTLYNDHERAIKGDFHFGLEMKRLLVYYRKVGGEFIRYFPRWLQIVGMGDFFSLSVEIPALGKKEATLRLFYNSYYKQLVTAGAGEYEFKATFNLGNDQILESNTVRLVVAEPAEHERAVLAALNDPVLASFIEGDLRLEFVEAAEVEAGAEKAAAFIEKYGSSMYTPLVDKRLRDLLEGAAQVPGKLTPKLKAIKERLPEK